MREDIRIKNSITLARQDSQNCILRTTSKVQKHAHTAWLLEPGGRSHDCNHLRNNNGYGKSCCGMYEKGARNGEERKCKNECDAAGTG